MTHINRRNIAVVGLGYVGLPVAIAFGSEARVVGFDINEDRVGELINGIDSTGEVSREDLQASNVFFTTDPTHLAETNFVIIAVPTPIDSSKRPDLRALQSASATVGEHLMPGTIVVYESTVYPGATEEVCVPILAETSRLRSGVDFKVGYSPERINPGDREHTFTKIKKIVAGEDNEALEIIAAIYESVVDAGVYRAESIKVAEAAKVIENTQRDLNLALMNELSIVFNQMDIDMQQVINAAATKWNFLKFEPGLVGGHCIGVDPYYLTYRAEQFGYHPQVILAGRRINDSMGKHVAENTIKLLISNGNVIKASRILIMGFTFKEGIPDIRNTKVIDIINELKHYGCDVILYDPYVDSQEVKREYGLSCAHAPNQESPYDAVVVAVKHPQFFELGEKGISRLLNPNGVLVDVKGIFCRERAKKLGMIYWSL